MSTMASDEVFKSRHSSSSSGSVSSSNSTGSSIHPLVDICNGSSSPSTPRLDRKTAKKGIGGIVGRKNSQQEQDVVKHGYLYIKRPPCTNTKIRFKAWQKKFFILRDMSFDNGVSTLEMYENQAAYESVLSAAEYVLDLKNVKNVDSYIESKRFPRAFMVLRSAKAPLVFGTSCDIHKSSWMETINVLAKKTRSVYSCKDSSAACLTGDKERRSSLPWLIHYRTNPLYTRTPPPTKRRDSSVERPPTPTRTDGPPTPPRNNSVQSNDSGSNLTDVINTKCQGSLVTVQPSSSSSKHRLVGDYYLNVCPGHLALTTVQSLRERLRWPIEHITKFKSEDLKTGENLVTLESSVFSGPSEGSYQFKTMHGSDLIKKVKDAASGVQYGILNTAPTPPPPIAERKTDFLKKVPITPQTSHSRNHLHLRTDLLREKSTSTPNLMERRKDLHKVQNGTIQRDVKKTELRYESSTVIASHGYIELLAEEQGDFSFSDVFRKDITRLNYDSDSQVFAAFRDSGFSDTDEDEACSLNVTVPPPEAEGTSSTTPSTHSSGTSKQQQQHNNVIYTQIQTPVDCRPPLPPKSCHRNNNLKDAFMDYYTDVKSLPQAPPVPIIRQTKV